MLHGILTQEKTTMDTCEWDLIGYALEHWFLKESSVFLMLSGYIFI